MLYACITSIYVPAFTNIYSSGEDSDHDDGDDDHSSSKTNEDGDVEELVIKRSDVQESTGASESGIFSGVSAGCDSLILTRLLIRLLSDSVGDF